MIKLIEKDVYLLNQNNYSQRIFEGEIPLSKGMSYNAYVILDYKTALLDSADSSVLNEFVDNLKTVLNGRNLDYYVIHHLEPDHTAGVMEVLKLYPDVTLYISALGYTFLKQFFPDAEFKNVVKVSEGTKLNLGHHELTFVNAPMVHWPEVVVSYDAYIKTLFSADAFGSFTVIEDIDSSDYKDQDELLYEERRYYTNIVGKYGEQVQNTLKKAKTLDLVRFCPLHGPIHTKRIPTCLKYYDLWSKYEKEEDGVLIVYCSIYGHSVKAYEYLDKRLTKLGVNHDSVNLNKEDFSIALSKSFIFEKIILIAPTFNMDLFPLMREYLLTLKDHAIKNKTFALIENGSWAPQAKSQMAKIINQFKSCQTIATTLTIKSSLKDSDLEILDKICDDILKGDSCQINKNSSNLHHFRCKLCGFILEADKLDPNFKCPLCGKDASFFEMID